MAAHRGRGLRAAGAVGVLLAAGLVAVPAGLGGPAPGAAVHPLGYQHQAWHPVSGCSVARSAQPRWNNVTRTITGFHSASNLTQCPSVQFGWGPTSTAITFEALRTFDTYVRLPTGTGGVNVTWAADLGEGISASTGGSGYACRSNFSDSVVYTHAYSTIWVNSTENACYLTANWTLAAYARVRDLATGSVFPADRSWSAGRTIEIVNNSTVSTVSYSNASYWRYNATTFSGGLFVHSVNWGAWRQGSFPIEFFVNGSFPASHHRGLVLTGFVESSFLDETGVWSPGTATAAEHLRLDGGAGTRLLPYVTW